MFSAQTVGPELLEGYDTSNAYAYITHIYTLATSMSHMRSIACMSEGKACLGNALSNVLDPTPA